MVDNTQFKYNGIATDTPNYPNHFIYLSSIEETTEADKENIKSEIQNIIDSREFKLTGTFEIIFDKKEEQINYP
ncbi:hypothetical protein BN1058_00313 [Paraliobacillus sp. PM-2]|uniref:hypothetical protein n=1 Tax=Paraliobacillus sp. PM-2 TaxID=1462524 RepID=UPI00061B8B9D|nr:hypothetical protein [Paraliobacillus sp. PM-2]CQR46068.1 hypothetical protein BN1058_00313 [Paraliobacillus sp. PM-2]